MKWKKIKEMFQKNISFSIGDYSLLGWRVLPAVGIAEYWANLEQTSRHIPQSSFFQFLAPVKLTKLSRIPGANLHKIQLKNPCSYQNPRLQC